MTHPSSQGQKAASPPSRFVMGATILLLLLLLGGYLFFKGPHPNAAPRESIRLGILYLPTAALAQIASEREFFAQEGLSAEIHFFPTGNKSIEALLGDQVDVITTAQTPFVLASFSHPDLTLFGTTATNGRNKIVARRDRSIIVPEDLRGKTVGTERGLSPHYFLRLFLLKYGIAENAVIWKFSPLDQQTDLLVNGEVDAISAREPEIGRAITALGTNAVVFDEPGLYVRTEVLIARREFLQKNRQAVEKLLRALVKAEDWAREHPEEASRDLAKFFGISMESMQKILDEIDLRVSLEQSIFPRLEEESQWMIDAGISPTGIEAPNYLHRVDTGPLEDVRPGAVTVFR